MLEHEKISSKKKAQQLFVNKDEFFQIIFLQIHKVSDIEKFIGKISSDYYLFHTLGKYDLVGIKKRCKELNDSHLDDIIEKINIQIQGWFSITGVELYNSLDLQNSDSFNKCSRYFEFENSKMLLISLLNLQDPITIENSLIDLINQLKEIKDSTNPSKNKNVNRQKNNKSTKNATYQKYLKSSLKSFSRFEIVNELIKLSYQHQLEMRIFTGFGRNEIIIITNLFTEDPKKLAHDSKNNDLLGLYSLCAERSDKTVYSVIQKPVKVSFLTVNYINKMLLQSDKVKRIPFSRIIYSRATDISSMICVSINVNNECKEILKLNGSSDLKNKIHTWIEEKVQLFTFVVKDNVLSTGSFKFLDNYPDIKSLENFFKGQDLLEYYKCEKNVISYPIFGYYDNLYQWTSDILECIERIIALKESNEKQFKKINTFTVVTLPSSKTIEEVLTFPYYYLLYSLQPQSNNNCKKCVLHKPGKKSFFFSSAKKRLFQLDAVVRTSFSTPGMAYSMRSICNSLKIIYENLEKYSLRETTKIDFLKNTFPSSRFRSIALEERDNYKMQLYNSLAVTHFVIQQRLSNLEQTRLLGSQSLEVSFPSINYEQIILAAEALSFFTISKIREINIRKILLLEKKWPSVIIGYDRSFSLIPPGFINLPIEFVYEPKFWSGIIHETAHYLFYSNFVSKKYTILTTIAEQLETVSGKQVFLSDFLEELICDLITLIVGFDFKIIPFLIASINNISHTFFNWDHVARMALVYIFAILHFFKETYPSIALHDILSSFEAKDTEIIDSQLDKKLAMLHRINNIILSIFYESSNDENEYIVSRSDSVTQLFILFCIDKLEDNKNTVLEQLYDLLLNEENGMILNTKSMKCQKETNVDSILDSGLIVGLDPSEILISLNYPENISKDDFESNFTFTFKYKNQKVNFIPQIENDTNKQEKSLSTKNNYSALINLLKWQETNLLDFSKLFSNTDH